MIGKCANPDCGAPFRYLREGRLFQVDRDPAGHLVGGPFLISENGEPHHLEHYWLCGDCAQRMTLAIDPQRGVVAVPLPRASGRKVA